MNNQSPNSNHQINFNHQIPITKLSRFGKLVIGYWLLFGYWCLVIGVLTAYAQDNNAKLVSLSKQIIEAKTNKALYAPFEELRDTYFKDNKYKEFVEFLKSLEQKKKSLEPFTNYYIAESRYYQLKHLQDSQSWDEYFAKGNTYRNQITEGAQKTIASTTAKEPINIYSRLLAWRFHKDQEDMFKEDALNDLLNATLEYSQDATDISAIKDVADQLSSYGEKGKSKELYKIYVDKLAASDIKDSDLEKIASDFYKQANPQLAQTLYDVYIERISKSMPKEKLIPALADIAKVFVYSAEGGSACGAKAQTLNDPVYAEKIFKKIEEIGGKDVFNEQLFYLRAFNLEKAKEFLPAKEIYIDLVKRFPETPHADESDFKVGIIYTYVARDINTGGSYFKKLAQKQTLSPQVISSLYQSGLLAQWQENSVLAKDYYNKLLERAKDDYKETVDLTKERLKEIDGALPIEYNLKTFLDVSLKDEYPMVDMTRLDLRSNPYIQKKDKTVDIGSHPFVGESGCLQVEVQYLWSGHIGRAKPAFDEASFNTNYIHNGTKEINLVVVTATGILDRDLSLLDIN